MLAEAIIAMRKCISILKKKYIKYPKMIYYSFISIGRFVLLIAKNK